MVSKEFAELAARKHRRARQLARLFPASQVVLEFVAEVYEFQVAVAHRQSARNQIFDEFRLLRRLVEKHGPEPLRDRAQQLTREELEQIAEEYLCGADTNSISSFFARVLLQPFCFGCMSNGTAPVRIGRCERCGHRPQVALLRTQGNGKALSFVCSLCHNEWPAARNQCPQCGADNQPLSNFQAGEFGCISMIACDQCKSYLNCVDLERCPEAIGDVDEMVALPLNLWARSQGYRKIQPNLSGI